MSFADPALRPPSLSHRLEYIGIRSTWFAFGLLPRWASGPLASAFAWVWYGLLPVRRALVLENLERAFPDSDGAWRARTARRCFAHFFGMFIFDAIRIRNEGAEGLRDMIAEVEGLEHCEAVGLGHKACMVVSAHFGNWEAAISYFSAVRKCPAVAVAKPMHNPLIERVVAAQRSASGWATISTRNDPLREIVATVRADTALVMLADQDARRDGMLVPFFSLAASTPAGPATLAYRFSLPILVVLCRRDSADGRYRARFYPPIYPDTKADRKSEVERLTRAHVAILEEAIREAPEQYFWFHNRWKTALRTVRKKG